MIRFNSIWSVVVSCLLISGAFASEPLESFTFSGKLTNSSGLSVSGSVTLSMTAALFEDELGGAAEYVQVYPAVVVEGGFFQLLIGPALPDLVRFSYLELEVQGQILSPRRKFLTLPFAIHAKDAKRLSGSTLEEVETAILSKAGIVSQTGSVQLTVASLHGETIRAKELGVGKINNSGGFVEIEDTHIRSANVDLLIAGEFHGQTLNIAELKNKNGLIEMGDAHISSAGVDLLTAGEVWAKKIVLGSSTMVAATNTFAFNGSGQSVTVTSGVTNAAIFMVSRFGIGTTTPRAKLHVAGTVAAAKFVGDGSMLTGLNGFSYIRDADSDTGIQIEDNPDEDIIHMGTDGLERLTITKSGDVGVGTTTPQSRLHVDGIVKATAFAGDGSDLTNLSIPDFPPPSTLGSDTTSIEIDTTTVETPPHIHVRVDGQESMFVSSVGVGIGVAFPRHALEVSGVVMASRFSGDGTNLTNVLHPGDTIDTNQISNNGVLNVGDVAASGTVTASAFVGDGTGLTGILLPGATINTDQISNNGVMNVGDVAASGTVTASAFVGDGSGLTNLHFPDVPMPSTLGLDTTFIDVDTTTPGTPSHIYVQVDGVESMFVSSVGVGIGVPSPAQALEVSGVVVASHFSGDGTSLTNVMHPGDPISADLISATTLSDGIATLSGGILSATHVQATSFSGDGSGLSGVLKDGMPLSTDQSITITADGGKAIIIHHSSPEATDTTKVAIRDDLGADVFRINEMGDLKANQINAGQYFGDGSNLGGVFTQLNPIATSYSITMTADGGQAIVLEHSSPEATDTTKIAIRDDLGADVFRVNELGMVWSSDVHAPKFIGDGSQLSGVFNSQFPISTTQTVTLTADGGQAIIIEHSTSESGEVTKFAIRNPIDNFVISAGGDLGFYGHIRRLTSTLYGNQSYGHTNLGDFSQTGENGQNRQYATVGGGFQNSATNNFSTISGGQNNIASGIFSTVGGGDGNVVGGNNSVVPGGSLMTLNAGDAFAFNGTGTSQTVTAGLAGAAIFMVSRLGVGTTDPVTTVDIVGDVNISGQCFVNGSPVVGGSSPFTDNSTHIVYNGGNLGLGVNVPEERLVLEGRMRMNPNTDTSGLDGTIRWTGDDLEVKNAGYWVSLMSGSSSTAHEVEALDNYMYLADVKPSGTNGGSAPSTAWTTRDLQTIVKDDGNLVQLSGNRFTLQAGSYYLRVDAPAYKVARHLIRLVDSDTQQGIATGTASYASGSDLIQSRSFLLAQLSLVTSETFEIQHWTETAQTTNGFGVSSGQGEEIFTRVEIWKEDGFSGGPADDSTALGQDAFIGAGTGNSASATGAFVGAGMNNQATTTSTFIGGGDNNGASGGWASVAGGESNTAPGEHSFVGGGHTNTAGGSFSAVAGGWQNNAWGQYSAIPGGNDMNIQGSSVFGFNGGGIGTSATVTSGLTNAAVFMVSRFGIGTTTPASELQVEGDAVVSSGLNVGFTGVKPVASRVSIGDTSFHVDLTAASSPLIAFDPNDYLSYERNFDIYQWVSGGKEVMRLHSSGSLAVGTATTIPGLKVWGPQISVDYTGEARFHLYNGGTTAEWVFGQKSGSDHDFKISKSVNASESDYLTIKTDGKVGIGTTSPGATLEVSGTAKVVDVQFLDDTTLGGGLVAFSTYLSTSPTISSGSDIALTWGSEEYDYGTNLSSGVFTAPLRGLYDFTVQVAWLTVVDQKQYRIKLRKNGSTTVSVKREVSSGATAHHTALTRTLLLEASDTIDVQVFQDSGGASSINTSTQRSYFQGRLIRVLPTPQ